jgi:hypothetical protein
VTFQCCVCYRIWFETRGVVLCKPSDVENVQAAAGVFNTGRNISGGVGGRKRGWKCRGKDGIYILEFLRVELYPVFCWLMNTNWPSHYLA